MYIYIYICIYICIYISISGFTSLKCSMGRAYNAFMG